MKTTIYDVDYFIKKFEAIPEEIWGMGTPANKCVLYYCNGSKVENAYYCEEGLALAKLFDPDTRNTDVVYEVNDGLSSFSCLGGKYTDLPTPKQRILAALYDIKAKQQPAEPKEKIIYKTVVIDTAVHKLQKQLTEN